MTYIDKDAAPPGPEGPGFRRYEKAELVKPGTGVDSTSRTGRKS